MGPRIELRLDTIWVLGFERQIQTASLGMNTILPLSVKLISEYAYLFMGDV